MTNPPHDYLQEIALAARKHTASTALIQARALFREAIRTPMLAPEKASGVRHPAMARDRLVSHLDTSPPSGLLH